MHLFSELKRRNVFRVSLGYIMACWLLLQVADTVLENIGAPTWVIQTLMLMMALGFPVAVFISWVYEVTPEGIKRESEVDHNQSGTHIAGRKLDRAILVLLVISLGYFIWESRFSERDDVPAATGMPEATAEMESPAAAEPQSKLPLPGTGSIAVLPFDNRSKLEDDVFFTEGIHDELLSNLAQIGSLKVISRTSVMRYQDTVKPIPEIGLELGVRSVLEGAVQRSGNTVRINVQLIDAETDEHLWAQTYDRELTAENLFAIQSEISQSIALSLKAELSPAEEKRIAATATANLEAYDAYLRGRQEERLATGPDGIRTGLKLYRQATDLDPDFAAAWAGQARLVLLLRETGFWGEIPLEDAFALARSNIDRALTIDPQSAEAHAVQARMHYEKYRFEEALESLNLALTFNPNLADAYKVKSNILSSLGQIKAAWESAIQALERDPFDRGSRFAAVSIVGSYRVPDHIRQLKSILAGQAEALLALDVIQAINSEASAADIYTRFGNDAGIYFLANNLKEVQGGVDQALRPIEVRLDLHFISDQLDAALRAFHSLSEERQLATINLERLSLIQMAMGQCEDGLESLNRAHGGQIRIHGQIPPNQTRSNPNLALNWIFCMRKVGRGQEAEPLLSEMRDYVATLRRNVNSGFSALEVKLHVIDGEYNEAIDTYARALDRREMSWNDRYDPVIRTLADQPQIVELNARIDEQINADRAGLGWPPTQVIALDSEPGQQVANQVSARDELNVIPE